jgi:L-amino acid N-acyltransferase YncA
MRVRVADPAADAADVARIYTPYVRDTIASFEEVPPSADEMAGRMVAVLAWTPWLVAEDDSAGVVGYAYASRHRERAGYRWSVDVSVYLDAAWTGRGIGRALYDELLPILRRQRFVNAYAGIGLPNRASVALHEAIGMRRVGVYERVGWKLGRWVDVAWYTVRLVDGARAGDDAAQPPEPIPFPELPTVIRALDAP